MSETEEKFDLILTILEQIQEKLLKIYTKILNEKFFSSEEKGSEFKGMTVPQDYDPLQEDIEVEELDQVEIKEKKYKISGKPCKYCTGLISWDEYDHTKKTGKAVHVDGDGYIIGNGSCPNWRD